MTACFHNFLRIVGTKNFKCTKCGMVTDGRDLKEWRDKTND